jgi:hypothetical protein
LLAEIYDVARKEIRERERERERERVKEGRSFITRKV